MNISTWSNLSIIYYIVIYNFDCWMFWLIDLVNGIINSGSNVIPICGYYCTSIRSKQHLVKG